jgi:hypothetical protein
MELVAAGFADDLDDGAPLPAYSAWYELRITLISPMASMVVRLEKTLGDPMSLLTTPSTDRMFILALAPRMEEVLVP